MACLGFKLGQKDDRHRQNHGAMAAAQMIYCLYQISSNYLWHRTTNYFRLYWSWSVYVHNQMTFCFQSYRIQLTFRQKFNDSRLAHPGVGPVNLLGDEVKHIWSLFTLLLLVFGFTLKLNSLKEIWISSLGLSLV